MNFSKVCQHYTLQAYLKEIKVSMAKVCPGDNMPQWAWKIDIVIQSMSNFSISIRYLKLEWLWSQ